jgi:hypothetical protein
MDALDGADDEQRRIFQGRGVDLELLERLLEVLARTLVFPAEAGALPDVGPAFAAAGLGGALLEAIALAVGVGLRRGGLVEQTAQVEEVLLGGGALLEGGALPLGDELVRGHGGSPWRGPIAERSSR